MTDPQDVRHKEEPTRKKDRHRDRKPRSGSGSQKAADPAAAAAVVKVEQGNDGPKYVPHAKQRVRQATSAFPFALPQPDAKRQRTRTITEAQAICLA